MVAVPLLFGHLTAADYEDSFAADPRIDALREKMQCSEERTFTADYHDPEKRSIANSLTAHFPRRNHDDGDGRISPRPPSPQKRGHPAAGRKVPHQPGAAI